MKKQKKEGIKALLALLFAAGFVFALYCFALALVAVQPPRWPLAFAGVQLLFIYTTLIVIMWNE